MTLVVDTSALAAVVFGEPDAERFLAAMVAAAGDLAMSAATAVEAAIVVEAKQGAQASLDLELLIERLHIEVIPVDAAQASSAVAAWRRFGKGRHPAQLNFGDCFAYAAARSAGGPLLFKGEDFAQTDIRAT